jgi:hypothetical protein
MAAYNPENAMKLVERWHEYQPTKTQLFWTALGAVVATLIIGFGPGGWVTGGTARAMADETAATARHQLAAAVCADHFMRAADSRARLAKLQALEWWERDEHVADGGWATMPGEKEADGVVAQMCATRLAEAGKI